MSDLVHDLSATHALVDDLPAATPGPPATRASVHRATYPMGSAHRATFEAVYRAMVGFVRRVVHRQPVPPAQREDAVQDVFVVAYRRWHQLEGTQSLRAWLHGIALRTCWNYQRANRRNGFWMESPHDSADELPDMEGELLDEQFAREEDLWWLGKALERLDDRRKEALVLSRIEGRSAAEVARITGLSPNTVASRVRAALRDLRDDFAAHEMAGDQTPRPAKARDEPMPSRTSRRSWKS